MPLQLCGTVGFAAAVMLLTEDTRGLIAQQIRTMTGWRAADGWLTTMKGLILRSGGCMSCGVCLHNMRCAALLQASEG